MEDKTKDETITDALLRLFREGLHDIQDTIEQPDSLLNLKWWIQTTYIMIAQLVALEDSVSSLENLNLPALGDLYALREHYERAHSDLNDIYNKMFYEELQKQGHVKNDNEELPF